MSKIRPVNQHKAPAPDVAKAPFPAVILDSGQNGMQHPAKLLPKPHDAEKNEARKTAMRGIRDWLEDVIAHPTKPLPNLAKGDGNLCELFADEPRGASYAAIAKLVQDIDRKGVREYVHDDELVALARSIRPLYAKAWRAKLAASYNDAASEIQKVIDDPTLPLSDLTENKGGTALFQTIGPRYGVAPSTLGSQMHNIHSREMRKQLNDKKLVKLIASIPRLYHKAERVKKEAMLRSIISEIRKVVVDPTLPLPNLIGGDASYSKLAADKYHEPVVKLKNYFGKARDHKCMLGWLGSERLVRLLQRAKRLYEEAETGKRIAAFEHIHKEIEAARGPNAVLPRITRYGENLCKRAETVFGVDEGTLKWYINSIHTEKARNALKDKYLISLVESVRPHYYAVKKVKFTERAVQRQLRRLAIPPVRHIPPSPQPGQAAMKQKHPAAVRVRSLPHSSPAEIAPGGTPFAPSSDAELLQMLQKKPQSQPTNPVKVNGQKDEEAEKEAGFRAILKQEPAGVDAALEPKTTIYINGERWSQSKIFQILRSPSGNIWFSLTLFDDVVRTNLVSWSFRVFTPEQMGEILSNPIMCRKVEELGFRFELQPIGNGTQNGNIP